MAKSKSTPRRKPAAKQPSPPPPAPPTWDEQLIRSLLPFGQEIGGIILFLVAMITLLALPGWTDAGGIDFWVKLTKQIFGWGTYPLFLSLAALGLHTALRKVEKPYKLRANQVIGLEMIWLAALPLSYQFTRATLVDAYLGRGGGLVGWALAAPAMEFLGPFLTATIFLLCLLGGAGLLMGWGWNELLDGLRLFSTRLQTWGQTIAPPAHPPSVAEPLDPPFDQPQRAPLRQTAVSRPATPPGNAVPMDIIDPPAKPTPRKKRRSKRLPPMEVLEEGRIGKVSPEEIERKKQIIEETLGHFGLPATVKQIMQGPAVTQFGVEPGYIEQKESNGQVKRKKVRIGQITSLQKDLALALAAPRLRIQAPIPGRGVVGIEVPNSETAVVRLRPVIESQSFAKHKTAMTVGLGRDVSGAPVAIDLSKMPHLLIAGTTGSGKSVCINAMIACLAFNNSPEDLRLIMIDPKKVELIRFNGVPHLIGRVEVEADRAVGVLRWLTAEMDRRYEMFTAVGARNLNGYNRKIAKKKDVKKLPYMAVFIDELADLMHTYPGDVERTLCRLAQMARATGIHLIVATQRPSTDVITGLIKANFPARLSFSVASTIDSRVILDSTGAEHLLGKGDLLFLAPDASGPARIQGVFVNDVEIERIVEHWQETMPDHKPEAPPWENLIAKHALLEETDSLLEQAIELVQKQDFLSTSFLQRRLRVGYPRAARIMEHLYEMGLVEDPKQGGKTRKSYVGENDAPLDDLLTRKTNGSTDQ